MRIFFLHITPQIPRRFWLLPNLPDRGESHPFTNYVRSWCSVYSCSFIRASTVHLGNLRSQGELRNLRIKRSVNIALAKKSFHSRSPFFSPLSRHLGLFAKAVFLRVEFLIVTRSVGVQSFFFLTHSSLYSSFLSRSSFRGSSCTLSNSDLNKTNLEITIHPVIRTGREGKSRCRDCTNGVDPSCISRCWAPGLFAFVHWVFFRCFFAIIDDGWLRS